MVALEIGIAAFSADIHFVLVWYMEILLVKYATGFIFSYNCEYMHTDISVSLDNLQMIKCNQMLWHGI